MNNRNIILALYNSWMEVMYFSLFSMTYLFMVCKFNGMMHFPNTCFVVSKGSNNLYVLSNFQLSSLTTILSRSCYFKKRDLFLNLYIGIKNQF